MCGVCVYVYIFLCEPPKVSEYEPVCVCVCVCLCIYSCVRLLRGLSLSLRLMCVYVYVFLCASA